MKIILFFLFLMTTFNAFSQKKHDAQWVLGQDGEINMNFNMESVDITLENKVDSFSMSSSNISMCDSLGNLLFYSNGCEIRNKLDQIMVNGDKIQTGFLEDFYCSTAVFESPISQGLLALPMPGDAKKYYLFYQDLDEVTYPGIPTTLDPKRLYYSIVDMDLQNGLGEVTTKSSVVIEDTLALGRGQLTSVKHANGKDWWIITPKALTNCYYRILLNTDGLSASELICSGEEWDSFHGIGQAVFSPDGTKYARFNPWNGLHIFDFDRCKGELSNPIAIDFSDDPFGAAGLSISPNSRFLYAAARTKLYQIDLGATNVPQSRILIDTLNLINTPPFSAVFYLSQLAPDGKIYIAGTSSHLFFHVINEPDKLGAACDFKQQEIEIPALNFASIPNFPNFRLGAQVEECNPTVSTDELLKDESPNVSIFPNPSAQNVFIKAINTEFVNSNYILFDVNGIELYEGKLSHSTEEIQGLNSGVYFLHIQNKNHSFVEKIIIQND